MEEDMCVPLERLVADKTTSHQLVFVRGCAVVVLCETSWLSLISPSQEHEAGLSHSGQAGLLY